MIRSSRVAVAALVVVAVSLLAPHAGAAPSVEPVADGFVGPLGLAVGTDGTTYVAEAFAGQLTAIDTRGNRSVLYRNTDGAFVTGVDALGRGTVAFTVSLPPENEASLPDTVLMRVLPNGRTQTLASLLDHEVGQNPDAGVTYGLTGLDPACEALVPEPALPYTGVVDSNPYAVKIVPGGHLVADAAANAIIRVGANGRTSTFAVLPPVPQIVTQELVDELADDPEFPLVLPDCVVGATYLAEPVPTDIEIGPDGNYYVSGLPGFPESEGSAVVWRIDARTGAITEIASGMWGAVDLAVGADGSIYVAELFGDRVSVIVDGAPQTLVDLPMPGAIEVTRDGRLLVTQGVFGPGSLVRITP